MRALVLARQNFREYDQRIHLYTKQNGLVQLCAKGVKRPKSKNSSKLEPFSLVDIEVVHGKELSYIASVHVIEIFKEIRSSWLSSIVASNYIKTLGLVVKHELPDENIFNAIIYYLELLKEKKSQAYYLLLSTKFLLELGNCLGYEPEFVHCVICEENAGKYFALAHGGVVCGGCSRNISVEIVQPDTIKLLQYLIGVGQFSNTSVKKVVIQESYQIMRYFLQYHTEQKLPDLMSFSRTVSYVRV